MLDVSLGSCLLLAAKFNDDMKRDKIKELIEVIVFVLVFIHGSLRLWKSSWNTARALESRDN